MSIVHFITHPEVEIDPSVPVPDWRLSAVGRRRAGLMLERPWLCAVRAIFTSAERKAAELGGMMADRLGLSPNTIVDLGENDRSATGYLPRVEFEAMADAFFARPAESVCGWERAIDAQRRVVNAVNSALAVVSADGDVAIVSHGGVGTLLLCHLMDVPISRTQDQPGNGGGNVYRFDATTRRLITGWHRFEE